MSAVKKAVSWQSLGTTLTYTALIVLAIVNLFPFYWAILTAFKQPADITKVPPVLFTTDLTLDNFKRVLVERFDLFYRNSIVQVTLSVLGSLFFSSLAGFIFAKFEFRGKETIFKIIIATMMLPLAVLLIPMVVAAGRLKLINTMGGIVIPYIVVPYGIYLMRQFMETIPTDLIDAARMDGATSWQIFRRVMIPLSYPALSTLGIFFFLANWNRYLWPLVTVYDQTLWTLPVGSAQFANLLYVEYGPSAAASLLMMAPLALVFLIFQRGIVRGIALTGMK
jgi:ABC-type glycerol-3-phosphate transport system permease component